MSIIFKVDKNKNIYITRGDTAYLELNLTQNGKEYIPHVGDTFIMTVRKDPLDTTAAPLLVKTFSDGNIKFNPIDTSSLDFGEYFYDIQGTLDNEDINTVIGPWVDAEGNKIYPKFIVIEEVSV